MEGERGARSVGGSESIQTKDKEYTHGLHEGKDMRAKWNLGVSVEMVQMDREGAIIKSIQPGFKTSAITQLAMYNFDHTYANAVDKIQDKLIAFNKNGSGWVLKNVHNISIDIAAYEPIRSRKEDSKEILSD